MSSHALLCVVKPNRKKEWRLHLRYLHFGYPKDVGEILLEHWNKHSKVQELLDTKSDFSSIFEYSVNFVGDTLLPSGERLDYPITYPVKDVYGGNLIDSDQMEKLNIDIGYVEHLYCFVMDINKPNPEGYWMFKTLTETDLDEALPEGSERWVSLKKVVNHFKEKA